MVGRPSGSLIVETVPIGLLTASTMCFVSSRIRRSPSTWMTCVAGSTRTPWLRTTVPSTLTRPSAIICSDARLDATPAWASTFCSRTPPSV